MTLDLAIRGGTVATAADTMRCDVGVRDGRIVTLGEDVGPAARTIDAAGLLVLPGGIDSHVHLDQYQGEGVAMADGFRSGTTSAAAGGNTTVIAFALQRRGESLRAAVEATTPRRGGRRWSIIRSTSSSPTRAPPCWARSCRRWSATATRRSRSS